MGSVRPRPLSTKADIEISGCAACGRSSIHVKSAVEMEQGDSPSDAMRFVENSPHGKIAYCLCRACIETFRSANPDLEN